MTKFAEDIKRMFLFVILYSFFFYMGMVAADTKSDKKHKELQKRYTYTDNELDQCVKRNLELRREK